MHTFLHKKFQFNLNAYVDNHASILVAISSGQDSLCLLNLLTNCTNKRRYRMHLIYIDHQWKNNSAKHTQHIINTVKFQQLPIAIYQIKALPLSENEARIMRYKIIIQHAVKKKCKIIITGHNSNDKAETLISNLTRGTGLNGIANFSICKRINSKLSIVRPLINFSKAELGWLCRLFYLPIWSDDTNYNMHLKRSRIRYELMPYLQNFFNPNIQEAFMDFAELCQQDNEYIKENTVKLYIKSKHMKLTSLNLKLLSRQHKILQKRVFRLYFCYHFHKQINNKAIYLLLRLHKRQARKSFLIDGLVVQSLNGWLHSGIKESMALDQYSSNLFER